MQASSLFWYNPAEAIQLDKSDVILWSETVNIEPHFNAAIIDRTETIVTPYKLSVPTMAKMPKFREMKKTYEECCFDRCSEIIKQSEESNKPIYLFYSGGIDSTLVLIFFLKYLTDYSRLKIVCSMRSYYENPEFFKKYILGKFELKSVFNANQYYDGSGLIVSGEINDHLFGRYGIIKELSNKWDLNSLFNIDDMIEFYGGEGASREVSVRWSELVKRTFRDYPVRTFYDFLWWQPFCFYVQTACLRWLIFIENKLPSENFVEKNLLHFFVSPDFQLWSMNNPELRTTYLKHKIPARKLILDFTKDEDYFYNKGKGESLWRTFKTKKCATAINNKYQNIYSREILLQYYNPQNDFTCT